MVATVNDLKIAIAGLGVVGSEVARHLIFRQKQLESTAGRKLRLVAVSARDRNLDRGFDLQGIDWCDDPMSFVERDDIDVVVEMIGGVEGISLNLARGSLTHGKDLVTANKALLAHHGSELAKLAEKKSKKSSF